MIAQVFENAANNKDKICQKFEDSVLDLNCRSHINSNHSIYQKMQILIQITNKGKGNS